MLRYLPVRRIHARQVLDSRGTPTVEVEATVGEGSLELRDIQRGRSCHPEHRQEDLRRWNSGMEKKDIMSD